jgi:arabinogalactan endo-1,4-beta-galactosidase
MKSVDYDYITVVLSNLAWKRFRSCKNQDQYVGKHSIKKVVIAETAYPFTLGYNDWTNNIVGLDSQLVSEYPATPDGQKNFVLIKH